MIKQFKNITIFHFRCRCCGGCWLVAVLWLLLLRIFLHYVLFFAA